MTRRVTTCRNIFLSRREASRASQSKQSPPKRCSEPEPNEPPRGSLDERELLEVALSVVRPSNVPVVGRSSFRRKPDDRAQDLLEW